MNMNAYSAFRLSEFERHLVRTGTSIVSFPGVVFLPRDLVSGNASDGSTEICPLPEVRFHSQSMQNATALKHSAIKMQISHEKIKGEDLDVRHNVDVVSLTFGLFEGDAATSVFECFINPYDMEHEIILNLLSGCNDIVLTTFVNGDFYSAGIITNQVKARVRAINYSTTSRRQGTHVFYRARERLQKLHAQTCSAEMDWSEGMVLRTLNLR